MARNPSEVIRRVDAFQQRRRTIGFLFAVVKKFGDDRAGSLAALVAYYGFLAVFPLLLLLVTVLGIVLHGSPSLQQRVLDSALADFPIIGDQLRSNVHALRAGMFATIVGLVGLVWGSLGVTQIAQHAMAEVWNIEGKDRPGFATRLGRGLTFLVGLGVGVALSTSLAQLGESTFDFPLWRALCIVAVVAVNVAVYVFAFRLLTPGAIESRALVPGAVVGGVGWSALQLLGTYLIAHQLRHASEVYGLFAIVLGLLSWLQLNAQLTLYAAEVNVVRARRLWPRSLIQPPLTEPDREVLTALARQEARRPEQHVDVDFDDTPDVRPIQHSPPVK